MTAHQRLPDHQKRFARTLRHDDTLAECVMWKLLRGRRFHGLKFRRQHPFGKYVLDFYCEELKLVVELDGAGHLDPVAAERDAVRTFQLQQEGLTVVRIENNELLRSSDFVMQRLNEFVSQLREL